MDILPGFKLCRKGLHQYLVDKKQCPDCKEEAGKIWREKNKILKKQRAQEWYKANKEKTIERSKQWQENNPEKKKRIKDKWAKNNKKKYKDSYTKSGKKWREKNKAIRNELEARRRAAKKQAVPKWADLGKIKEIYKEASLLTQKTGIRYQVDHIYPLQSKYLCGFHVETNLQILTAEENASKGNRAWPGQLECQKTKND